MACLCMVFCACALAVPESSRAGRLQIITSFSPKFYEPFLDRFKALHPDIKISILNKKTTAAISEIVRGNNRCFDVFWSSSPDAFVILKQSGMLRRISINRSRISSYFNDFTVDDPGGYFYGFAFSGVGWMWNRTYFKREGLTAPRQWEDLESPAYYNHTVMSRPTHSGTTHLIVESILQGMGWEKGWGLLLRMAGNLVTLSARSFGVPEGVKSGNFGLGLVIDILGSYPDLSFIAFRYGEPVFLIPANIGALVHGGNTEEAKQFIDFILSPQGQSILLTPGIDRLPTCQLLYDTGKLDSWALLGLIKGGKARQYDADLSQLRYNLVNQLFDELITFKLLERRRLWKRATALDGGKNSGRMQSVKREVYQLLSAIPVNTAQSRNPEYNRIFFNMAAGKPISAEQQRQISRWRQFVERRLNRAKELLDSVSGRK